MEELKVCVCVSAHGVWVEGFKKARKMAVEFSQEIVHHTREGGRQSEVFALFAYKSGL